MEEPSNLMEDFITERQEVNPTYQHNVKGNETEESLSHYILSTTGNGTFTGRMKDEDFTSCVPIDSYESKTAALRQDIKRRPDIRVPHDHDIKYQKIGNQCPPYNLPKHFTNKDIFIMGDQRLIDDYENNNIPRKEPIENQEVHQYSNLRDDSKVPKQSDELVAPIESQKYQRVPSKDHINVEGHLHEVPLYDRVPLVNESSRIDPDLKFRNEILMRNKTFPSRIQVHENDRLFASSSSIDEGYASTEMIQREFNTNPKDKLPNSTITKHQMLSDAIQESSTRVQNNLRSDEVDAYHEFHGVNRRYELNDFGNCKAGLQDRLLFSKSPIGTAIRNELRQDAELQERNGSGHSSKSSNIMFMQSRRISPSPLILRTNYGEEDRQTSSAKTETMGFALQDPPRKIKRPLSNEFSRSTFVPAEADTSNSLVPIQEPGTPKRLKPSTYQDLQQNPNMTLSPHYQNLQQSSNMSSSTHYQNLQQNSNMSPNLYYQNHQQNLTVPSSPHIRTSSVIKTPTIKSKGDNVFVFPDTAPKPTFHEYRFHVSTHDSSDRLMKSDEEYLQNQTVHKASQLQAQYRRSPVTPQKGYNSLTRGSTEHGLYYGQQISPEKRGPLRSQSNIEDKSPSKLSIDELDRIRIMRSISLPASEHDHRFVRRSLERQESGYHYHNGARRELFRENSQMGNVARGPWNFDPLQSINELGVPVPRRPSNTNGTPAMWNNQYYDQYVEHVPHPHTFSCCSSFTRQQPRAGDLNQRCQGDIDLTIQCSSIGRECRDISQQLEVINHRQHNDRNCECKRVEDDVLQLALDAYRKIPKECYTLTEQRQREQELQETNEMVLEAIKVALRMKELCSHGRSVSRIYNGSVVIRLNCPTLNSLENLWLKYKSGDLQTLINNIFITPSILLKNSAKFISLSVTISEDEYHACQSELASSVLKSTKMSPSKNASPLKRSPDKRAAKSAEDLLRIPDSPKLAMTKSRCSSTPILLCHSPLGSPMENYSPNTSSKRERKFSFGDQSRRAFQDLNSPRSPNLFNLEEIRQIVESPLFDQEEDDQENISTSFQSRGSNSRWGSPYSPLVSPKSPNCSPRSPRYSPR